jgi:hypothetical protein
MHASTAQHHRAAAPAEHIFACLLQDGRRISESSTSSTSPVKHCPANQALPSLAAKRKAASQFVRECTGIAPPYATDQLFRAALKDGVLLCKVVNAVWPNAVKEVGVLTCVCEHAPLLVLHHRS